MKRSDRLRREADETKEKIRALARHIRNVEDNCLLLGEKLIDSLGEVALGKSLIANGYVHDASKFYGIEFEQLSYSKNSQDNEQNAKLKLKMAVQHHSQTNKHHPEYWSGIHHMPRVAVAEMVADWKSRSEEFGTDLRVWINDSATKRWGFSKEDKVYNEIMEFVDLLCPKPFENVSQS